MYQKLLTTYAELIQTEDLISKAAKKEKIDLTEKLDEKVLDIPVLEAIPEYDMDEVKAHYHTGATIKIKRKDCIGGEKKGCNSRLRSKKANGS